MIIMISWQTICIGCNAYNVVRNTQIIFRIVNDSSYSDLIINKLEEKTSGRAMKVKKFHGRTIKRSENLSTKKKKFISQPFNFHISRKKKKVLEGEQMITLEEMIQKNVWIINEHRKIIWKALPNMYPYYEMGMILPSYNELTHSCDSKFQQGAIFWISESMY